MRKFLRFVFSVAEQANIDVTSIQAVDAPFVVDPVAGNDYPQSLQLSFALTGAAPQVRPLFPGELTFIPDPTAPGVLPAPDDVDPANYSGWRTRGRIHVRLSRKQIKDEFLTLMRPVVPIPTTLWYGPVDITESFLFTTLATGLQKKDIVHNGTTIKPGADAALWLKHAVAKFLAGLYTPELRLGSTAADDDVVRFPMPQVVASTDSRVSLTITVARTQKPQDARQEVFSTASPGVPPLDPAHKSHGTIPARHVYRTMRSEMLGADPGDAVPDAILADWPAAPRYFPLRFTRTWRVESTFSAFLPETYAYVQAGGAVITQQRLPAHGVLYVPQQPATPEPAAPAIEVTMGGAVRWLDGATSNVWRQKGATATLSYPLATAQPHIVVRRRMRDEMFSDESRPAPGDDRCTYMSLRRTIRALVNNRIAGGRLIHETTTTKLTRELIDDAFSGTTASSATLRDGKPRPTEAPSTASPRFIPIWIAFFPNTVPAQTIGGSNHRDTIFTLGEVAYYLWQVGRQQFEEGTKRNFADAHVGRGSAGALVATGLAAGYAVDPVRAAGEGDEAYFDRIVEAMITVVEPGSLTQFWQENVGFEALKDRRLEDLVGFGHSPVVEGLMPIDPATNKPGGIRVIDQFGSSDCPIDGGAGSRLLQWGGDIEIWCAAGWDE